MAMSEAVSTTAKAPARWQDYVQLLKPRVMSLVVFTGLTGLVCANAPVNPILGAVAILCIAVGAGASGALNMWYDADIDAKMRRTRGRPVPAGRGQGAALRGAQPLHKGGLKERWGADDAGGRGRGLHPPPDPDLQRALPAVRDRAGLHRPGRRGLSRRGDRGRPGVPAAGVPAVPQ